MRGAYRLAVPGPADSHLTGNRQQEDGVRLEVDVPIDAPRAVVWAVLTDWERQADWMVDAVAVHVLTPHREGEGVTVRVPTRLLGLTVQDVMRVTGWVEQQRLEVVHLGRVITGSGAFVLADDPRGGTHVTWEECIDPPLGALGEWVATRVLLPVLRRVFRRSLHRLAVLAERSAATTPDQDLYAVPRNGV